jgi:sterol desaturase/sphingolipid hydroxylase (fatty acid hydroxylase superfamily)
MRCLIKFGYVPAMYVGFIGSAVYLAGNAGPFWAFAVLVAAAAATSFLAERRLPYEPAWNHDVAGDSKRDAVHAFVNESVMLASVGVIPLLAALHLNTDLWPTSWPLVVQVLGAVLVADFGITVAHIASHRVDVLWRFHAVHHSVTRSYGLNGLMKHPVSQIFETTVGVLPLIALGVPTPIASALAVSVAVQLLLQHSNVDYTVGPLRSGLSLNEGHRFHHLKWAGIGDVNFGLFTLLWDYLFRTYSFDPERRFTSNDLGIAAKPGYPVRWAPQMLEPFRASGACMSTPTRAEDVEAAQQMPLPAALTTRATAT